MSWLFPLYLAGAAAIIAPILLHLRRQPPRDRVAFSSLMFLEAAKRQPTRRRRLENWLLLLARCLILILLALMFARPYQRGSAAGMAGAAEAVVVLVDRSASMRRADLWPRALRAAREILDDTAAESRVALGFFDSGVEWVLAETELEQTAPAARRAALDLAATAPGWGATDLGGAMEAGLQVLGQWESAVFARRRMIVVSDFQEGARLTALQRLAWPQDVLCERRVLAVDAAEAGNLSLELVAGRLEAEDDTAPVVAGGSVEPVRRVRVSSKRESQNTVFELAWESARDGAVVQGYLPPGGRRVIKMPPRGSDSAQPGVLKVSGDRESFDNRVYVAPMQPLEVKVRLATAAADQVEAAASPGYYLRRALQPTAAIRPVLETVTAGQWPQAENSGLWVSAGDGSRLGEEGLAAWRRALNSGALAVYVVDGKAAESELNALTEGIDWKVEEAERAGSDAYAMLGELDAGDALLRPFADARLGDFTKVRFWRHRTVLARAAGRDETPESVKVLARFDNGDPAMLAVRQSAGTLLVLASGWHPADSQLALSTKFVPLLFGWLAAAGYSHEEEAALEAGQPLPWTIKHEGRVTLPDGAQQALAAGASFIAPQPGVYRVEQGGAEPLARWFAVQLPAGEGRVSVLPEERLAELGVKLADAADSHETPAVELSEEARQRLDAVATESRQRLWLWVLAGILALVAAESLLASRRGTEPATAEA